MVKMQARWVWLNLIGMFVLISLAIAYGQLRTTPMISFIADIENQTDIYLLDPSNRGLVNITNTRAPEWSFGWSGNGSLYYTASVNPSQVADELFVMQRLGAESVIDTPDTLYSFGGVWSPDGTTFAYFSSHPRNVSDIYVITFPDETVRNLTQTETISETNPLWSPDGRELLYELEGDLHLIDINTGVSRVLADMNASELEDPVWSPDGQWIIFYIRTFSEGQNRLLAYLVSRDGTALHQLDLEVRINSPVTWSPDSQSFALIGDANNLLFYDLQGNQRQQFTGDNRRFAPAWSPDGTMIAYIENRHLYIYDLTTQTASAVLTQGRVKPPLRWQP